MEKRAQALQRMKEDAESIRRAQANKVEQLQMEAERKQEEAEEAERTGEDR